MYIKGLKPILDVLICLPFFGGFLLVLIFIAPLYIIFNGMPIFFLQKRIGLSQKPFNLIKFRTLKVGEGPPSTRKFWLGNLLRATSLDELPQLINVLKGEMSLVGPRPLPIEYLPLFSKPQSKRHSVKPGITGWAQVNGRHSISWERKFELDLFYVEHRSFWLDLKILLKTAILLLSFKKDNSLNEKKFTGNHDT